MSAVVINHSILAASASVRPSPGFVSWNLVALGLGQIGVWVDPGAYQIPLLNIVYAFHVALFAFVGGTVTRADAPLVKFAMHRAERLLVPYVAWLAVSLAVSAPESVAGWLNGVAHGLINPHASGALWFLPVYFVCVVLVRAILGARWGRVLLAVSACGAPILACFPTAPFLRYLGDVLWLYPFVAVGALAGSTDLWAAVGKRSRTMVISAVTLVSLGFALTWPPILGSSSEWLSIEAPVLARMVFVLGRYSAAIGIIMALLVVASRLRSRVAILDLVGRNSIGVYASHSLLIGPLVGRDLHWSVVASFALASSLVLTSFLKRVPYVRGALLGVGRMKHGAGG